MPHLARHPFFLPFLVVCATLAGEVVRPSKASAGCGDYVVYPNKARAGGHHSDMPPDDPKPVCHGPRCSQPLPIPATPGVPTKTQVTDDRVGLETTADTPVLFSTFLSLDLSVGPAIRRGTDVFHPPR
jgi:hypothetical protein